MQHVIQHDVDPQLEFGVSSDLGPRSRMEDRAAATGRRFAVFDGLGGHGGGDLAAQAAAAAFAQHAETLEAAVAAAQQAVLVVQGTAAHYRAPMTTVVALEISAEPIGGWSSQQGLSRASKRGTAHELRCAWAGDSRAYVCRASGSVEQLTQDHGAGCFVSRCLGGPCWTPSLTSARLYKGDLVLLSSDGLHDCGIDIPAILAAGCHEHPQVVAERLIAAAVAFGTSDNSIAVIVRCKA